MSRHGNISILLLLLSLNLISCSKEEAESTAMETAGAPTAVLEEIARWRALGGVTELKDLSPLRAAPGTPNAADSIYLVMHVLDLLSPDQEDVLSNPWETQVESIEQVLDSFSRVMTEVRAAASTPYCDWGTRFEDGPDAPLNEYLLSCRNAVRLLTADARVKTADGDFAGATKSLMECLQLSDHSASDPLIVCMQMSGAIVANVCGAIEDGFSAHESFPIELRRALEKRDHRALLTRAFSGHGAMMINEYKKLAGGTTESPIEGLEMPGSVAAGLVWNLRTLGSFIEQCNRPYFQMTAADEAQPPPGLMPESAMDAQMLDDLCRVSGTVENLVNVALAAADLREYRATHGEYPNASGFKTPVDVLTGRPIEYLQTDDGFTLRVSIYSPKSGSDEDVWEW